MENLKNTEGIVSVLNHDRSYAKSLTLGLKTSFNNMGTLLRFVWPSMLLTMFVPFVGILFFAGQTDAILRRWTDLGYVPNVNAKALWLDIKKCTFRNLFSFIILILIVALMSAFLILPIITGHNPWYGVVAFVVLSLIVVPVDGVFMKISYSSCRIIESISGIMMGLRNYGSLFAFMLISGILSSITCFIGSLPMIATAMVKLKANEAVAMGDLADLPSSFIFYLVAAYAICMFVALVTMLCLSFSHCLLWGSIEKVPTDSEMEVSGIDGIVGSPE